MFVTIPVGTTFFLPVVIGGLLDPIVGDPRVGNMEDALDFFLAAEGVVIVEYVRHGWLLRSRTSDLFKDTIIRGPNGPKQRTITRLDGLRIIF
jgi:hypothetical protein